MTSKPDLVRAENFVLAVGSGKSPIPVTAGWLSQRADISLADAERVLERLRSIGLLRAFTSKGAQTDAAAEAYLYGFNTSRIASHLRERSGRQGS